MRYYFALFTIIAVTLTGVIAMPLTEVGANAQLSKRVPGKAPKFESSPFGRVQKAAYDIQQGKNHEKTVAKLMKDLRREPGWTEDMIRQAVTRALTINYDF